MAQALKEAWIPQKNELQKWASGACTSQKEGQKEDCGEKDTLIHICISNSLSNKLISE
jgi:hypothetical protein